MRATFTLPLCLLFFGSADLRSSAAAQEHEHPAPEKLGAVNFPNSCSASVQKQFERGVALLHSFAYSAAEKAFRDVAEADPNCAMAHWGVAMTYVHQLWEPQLAARDVARGQFEMERARQIGGSERERGFIKALNLIYTNADSVPYRDRANSYSRAMGELAARNPNDVECQVFYALALIATASLTDKTHANEKKAAALLEPLFRKYPQHPGIPHYLIHAYDNSELASRGVAVARAYSQIAPSAPHALHMPSHIYTRLGMWQDSIASNLAARTAARAQGDIGEELHAMDYLTYAYLQLGRDAEAARTLEDLRAMSGLHTDEFIEATQLAPLPTHSHRFLPSPCGLASSDLLAAGSRRPHGRRSIDCKLRTSNCARPGMTTGPRKFTCRSTRRSRGRHTRKERTPRRSSSCAMRPTKRMLSKSAPLPPGAIVPAREQLGDLLLELSRPKEALKEFEVALAMAPQRRGALGSAARAAEMAGKRDPTK